MTKTGRAVVLTAVAGESGLFQIGCQSRDYQKTVVTKPDFLVPADPRFPKVAVAYNPDHAQAVVSALEAIGGIRRFVKKGEKVLLKPNVAWDRVPEQGVNTNPIVVGEIVRQCYLAGASEVLVTDYGSDYPQGTFSRSGISNAVRQNGGRVFFPGHNDFLEIDLEGKFITRWPVLSQIFDVDRLINMPIAKHHGLVYGTASMKNFFGAIGGVRDRLHARLDQAIVDLAAFFQPTLTVIDATRILMRNGPGGGSFDDVKICNAVICATDQVAADARAGEFLDISCRDIGHVVLAARQGLGEIDYRKAGYLELPAPNTP